MYDYDPEVHDLVEFGDLPTEVQQDFAHMKWMTCANHPTAVYLTKHPAQRSLHFIEPCDEAFEPGWVGSSDHGPGRVECPCPFGDLRVVVLKSDHGVILAEDLA